MLAVELAREAPWPDDAWEEIARNAVHGAVSESGFPELLTMGAVAEVSVSLVSDDAIRTLNRQYRGKDSATNVLSFPMVQPDLLESVADTDDGEVLLGDIVLAYETCAREAAARNVALTAHAAHLIVHGTLHLLGHDHMTDAEAETMETIERDVMATLGLHDPYPPED